MTIQQAECTTWAVRFARSYGKCSAGWSAAWPLRRDRHYRMMTSPRPTVASFFGPPSPTENRALGPKPPDDCDASEIVDCPYSFCGQFLDI